MNHRLLLLASLFALLLVVLGISSSALSPASAADALTGYYNLLGYEGIGMLGSHLANP
jgi:hypothetical protein